ncbi:MAG: hypothetical protein ACRDSL_17360 [Pseudonocardiaceae bacterium]
MVPSRWVLGPLGVIGTLVVLVLVFPTGPSQQPAMTQGNWVLVPMLVAPVLLGGAAFLIRRWARSQAWSDQHSLAMAGGAVVGHTIFGAFVMTSTTVDRFGLIGVAAVIVVLIGLLDRRIQRRPATR